MDEKQFYTGLYQTLDEATPLRFDCGRLCGRACCRVDSELPGMHLYPGEEALFLGKKGYTVTESSLPGYGRVLLLSCRGECIRTDRPLACRVFPLAPAMVTGGIGVRPDPRGRRVCPLCRDTASALSGDFTAAVRQAFDALAGKPSTEGFLRALIRHLDEFGRPL